MVSGGVGDDVLIGLIGDAAAFDGGPGSDYIQINSTLQGHHLVASTGTWNMVTGDLTFTVGDTTALSVSNLESASLPGWGTAWTVTGTPGNDYIGGDWNTPSPVTFYGLGGDDTFRGSDGDDLFNGGPGDDHSYGMGAGDDTCISVETIDGADCERVSWTAARTCPDVDRVRWNRTTGWLGSTALFRDGIADGCLPHAAAREVVPEVCGRMEGMNRLAAATSPYLLQHADNPVDWWEWGDEAFAEARRRGVPVFLSVGYAACHWCHVMAHESFEDDATAAQLNADFVCVKVDREERPDVDAVYMEATVAMTGQGGWPMTVVLDHDGSPFFAGTYFPDRPRGGQPSLRQVLTALTEAWRDRPDDVRRAADDRARPPRPRGRARRRRRSTADDLDARGGRAGRRTSTSARRLRRRPEVPADAWCSSSCADGADHDEARRMLDRTLEAMARGGIHDQLAGGFARYSVDAGWVVPHFEKMLYDNAQLVGLYARWGTGARRPGRRRHAPTGCSRELGTPEGGFASALDADSEGEEGRFYVWTPEQLADVLGDGRRPLGDRAVRGHRHLRARHARPSSFRAIPTTGAASTTYDAACWPRASSGSGRSVTTRSSPPGTAWRSAAWSTPGRLLGREEYVDAALAAGELLVGVHLVDGRLRRVSRDGPGRKPGRRARGLRRGRGRVPRPVRRDRATSAGSARATDLLDAALAHFRADDGGFFDTPPTASGWSPGRATRATTPAPRAPRPRSTRSSRPTR